MIPKIIHYCWFGKNPKSEFVKKCIKSWQLYLPDYKIIEWNETNCDIENACDFVKQAYQLKKWAFVSDFFRLKALKEYGGLYFDTDVEVIKSFDDLLNNEFFCGFESEGYLCTAVIGCEKNCEIIRGFLSCYVNKDFQEIPNSKLLFDILICGQEVNINNHLKLDDCKIIFPVDYFSPKDFYTKQLNLTLNTHAIHHFDGTWKSKNKKFKDNIQNFFIKLIGKEKYFTLKNKFKNKD